ncbi:uncharacterized protein LOC131662298 [Vicia villosa]|uniref:uncharacterized protein LOC131662298 n=1 Tax=Vicia villosa TaxID=3911 RepID=UPI00273BF16E|nr:uncharacterized protein LOC131662298 [Vicia villosa]
MSISELISELRDSFRQRDFDRVEETLIARETKLKAEIEANKREIGLLKEEVHFQQIEKMTVEMELKRMKELKDGGDIACTVAETANVRVNGAPETLVSQEAALKSAIKEKVGEIIQDQFKNLGKPNFDITVHVVRDEKPGEEFKKVGVHDGKACLVGEQGKKDGPGASGNDFGSVEETVDVREATVTATIEDKMEGIRLLLEKTAKREKYATTEVKDDKIDVLAEETRLASEPSKKAGLGSSGNWLTNSSRVVPENIATKLVETENSSRVVPNNITTKLGEPGNSSRAVPKNFATKLTEPENSSRIVPKNFLTKLAEPARVIKRDFASSIADVSNYLDGLENNSSSSSSSSSSSGEFDISSFTPVKRTKLSQGK